MSHSPDVSLQPNERIEMVLHRHWMGFVKTTFIFTLLAALPVVASTFLQQNGQWQLQAGTTSYVFAVMAATVYAAFWLVLFFGFWLDFSLDYYLVTNIRIIDVHQSGLFDRTVAEEYLTRVQDVTTVVRGLFPTLINYGHVHIQTAGERQRFIFLQVPHPNEVSAKIMALIGKNTAGGDGTTPQ